MLQSRHLVMQDLLTGFVNPVSWLLGKVAIFKGGVTFKRDPMLRLNPFTQIPTGLPDNVRVNHLARSVSVSSG